MAWAKPYFGKGTEIYPHRQNATIPSMRTETPQKMRAETTPVYIRMPEEKKEKTPCAKFTKEAGGYDRRMKEFAQMQFPYFVNFHHIRIGEIELKGVLVVYTSAQ